MKLAITGVMCSGKSTLSNYLVKNHNFYRIGFGDFVKKYAIELFNMKIKDRKLLQMLGEKLKEIDNLVWINLVKKEIDRLQKDGIENIVIDDVRFENEVKFIKENGFKLVKLTLPKDLQITRLKKTYPQTFKTHLARLEHSSELNCQYFKADLEIKIISDCKETLYRQINSFINK